MCVSQQGGVGRECRQREQRTVLSISRMKEGSRSGGGMRVMLCA
jgi:hypothetical protein